MVKKLFQKSASFLNEKPVVNEKEKKNTEGHKKEWKTIREF